ncbi:hypothetical protein [Azoarcus indigens]|uniref:Glyoxalase/bleomycin resistance protein/dioxygenase superfamily protein n=1 Tax=Azoarcus indigens TaxID=29545 RepID=A0A4R6DHH3_9RHOO|nr:hypothetical protein [Azoarcus indigens]TDN43518.1 hypothetical protein C7389_1393 [Azoarcus indigens]
MGTTSSSPPATCAIPSPSTNTRWRRWASDGVDGPPGHPDLKGIGRDNRAFFWLRAGAADSRSVHLGFVANSEDALRAFHGAALAAGARTYYDPRYEAANILDPDGCSVEAVYKRWQHARP